MCFFQPDNMFSIAGSKNNFVKKETSIVAKEKGGQGCITEGKIEGKRMLSSGDSQIKTVLPIVFPIGPFILNTTKFSPLENCLQSKYKTLIQRLKKKKTEIYFLFSFVKKIKTYKISK